MNMDTKDMLLIPIKRDDHFYKLFDDGEYAEEYFKNFDYSTLNIKTLRTLEDAVQRTQRERETLTNLDGWAHVMKSKKMADYFDFRAFLTSGMYIDARNNLELFESNLCYLIISQKFTLEEARNAGFDDACLFNLLDKYKKKAENPYIKYYYNEETGRTYVESASGNIYPVAETPEEVLVEVCRRTRKQ